METSFHRCARLLTALEDLANQEALLISSGDYDGVLAVQERAAPLVAGLALVAGGADAALRRRASDLITLRARSREQLAVKIELAREELGAIEASRNRMTQIVPAYRPAAVPARRRQFSACG